MIWILFTAFFSHALALPPVNFVEERVSVEGHEYIITNQNGAVLMTEETQPSWPLWMKETKRTWNNLPPIEPEKEAGEWGCRTGCLVFVLVSVGMVVVKLLWG